MNLVEVAVDQASCTGCLACVELAPGVFGFDQMAQVAVVLTSPCPADIAHLAASYCPVDCIEVIGQPD